MNILLADDDSKIHLIVTMWLQKNDHWVEIAPNGQKALEMLKQGGFDCLITDINMPLMNGIELVRETLKLPRPPDLILILTSRCDIQQLRRHFNDPKVHLLNKPFSPATLADLIQKFCTEKTAKT